MFDNSTDASNIGQTQILNEFGPQGSEGLGIHHFRSGKAPRLSGLSDRHTIILNRSSNVEIACTIGRQRLDHIGMAGNVSIIPAGVDWTATAKSTLDNIIVSIPDSTLAMAAARADQPYLAIASQMRGADYTLAKIVNEMICCVPADELNTRWYDLTDELADYVAACYSNMKSAGRRGWLTNHDIKNINSYLSTRLEQKIAIDELAAVVAHSASHFPRVFRQTLGMSPHQYVVRLRLHRARKLIIVGLPIADAAASSGFVDQSHLSYWVRRIYGTTPGRWAVAR